jgi:membrane protein DedA with SNARE-associated domain
MTAGERARPLGTPWLWVLVAVVLLLLGFTISQLADELGRLRNTAESTQLLAYTTVFLLVFLDGICALFPAETTLNTATAIAVDGHLDVFVIMVAGALGAVGGDSALYWLARLSHDRFQAQLDRALRNPKVAGAMELIGSSAPVLLCVGRYAPGLRFVVNASCGLSRYPYRRFLLWSAIGGTAWSIVTCTIAYLVASALDDQPIAAIVLSSCVSTVAIAFIFVFLRRRRRALVAGQTVANPS